MSFDIFLLRFEDGDASDGDPSQVLDQLRPFITEQDESWARVTTVDGEADVFGIETAGSNLMINHASGEAIWELIVAVARAGQFAIIPGGIGTYVTEPELIAHFPDRLPEPFVVISSGEQLRRAIESG